MISVSQRLTPFLLFGGLLIATLGGTPLLANNIQVNTTADPGGPGVCALRDAITSANMNIAVNGCPAGSGSDIITFTVSGTIILSSTLPDITDPAGLRIDGSGQSITVSGNNAVRVMHVAFGAVLTLNDLTVANANAGFGFGSGNDPDTWGGGIYNDGSLTVTNSTFSGNRADAGGAILSSGNSILTVVVNSTFSGNSASTIGGGIVNSTILTVTNRTFSGNSAPTGWGGGINSLGGGAVLNLVNTILANNTGGDCANLFGSTVNTSRMNLVKDGSCGASIVADPMLGPLADNGGPTMTMALLKGSPAIDTADVAICAAAPVNNLDQRGEPRSTDGKCDIGAYEYLDLFPFTGLFAPVANPPTVNVVNAGSAIPVQFSLGGNQGLAIFASGYPLAQKVSCTTGSPAETVTSTATAGSSGLSYDPTSETYTYVWKTQKSWVGTCQQLVMRLSDGSYHVANFQFN